MTVIFYNCSLEVRLFSWKNIILNFFRFKNIKKCELYSRVCLRTFQTLRRCNWCKSIPAGKFLYTHCFWNPKLFICTSWLICWEFTLYISPLNSHRNSIGSCYEITYKFIFCSPRLCWQCDSLFSEVFFSYFLFLFFPSFTIVIKCYTRSIFSCFCTYFLFPLPGSVSIQPYSGFAK